MENVTRDEQGGRFRWRNLPHDPVYSGVSFHVLCAYRMKLGPEWARKSIRTHYDRLYYVESGHALLEIDGTSVMMEPGNLYLIPANTLHRHSCEDHVVINWCHFQAETKSGLGLFELLRMRREFLAPEPDVVQAEFMKLVDAMEIKEGWGTLRRTHILLGLLMPFLELADESTAQTNKANYLPVFRYIDSHLNQRLTLEILARQMGLSPEHFCRIFSRDFELTPMRYVIHKRVQLAQHLLCQSAMKHYEICERCGFSDPFHFSKTFKQTVGLTPSDYRHQNSSES
jgi:AraC-like DNA-binding protein/mannose-6-phosphate isomerase-like protein (cupin superfamily)